MEQMTLRTQLDAIYQQVDSIILSKQHPITGLLPASTAVTSHGNYTDAWVRDNVYSIQAVWGLALAYRNLDSDTGRGFTLEQCTVKLMRGLLRAMMAQSDKVEAFKQSQALNDALHAKYETATGRTVVGDDEWGHLQIDATSIYLLMLVQMISSGLDIIWTIDEVNFIQNLIYYIERAYRTPDYGMWERGEKMNRGSAELNASSLGMAKAALEALSGFDLFGGRGSQASVLHTIPDNIAHAEITLNSMLPRESVTKEVDAAVLSIIGYPAFAVHDKALINRTRYAIIKKLEGRYGLKRFLLDGHQSVLEDENRLHYNAEELKQFEDIESEWPLFFSYLFLDALFRRNHEEAADYRDRLHSVMVEVDGQRLLPELYFVPADAIDAEKANPHSQDRLPNANVPLVWAQSLYLLGEMIFQGVLSLGDIDPLGRRRHTPPRRPIVQIVLLAEDAALQTELAAHGILTETPEELLPIDVRRADEIAEVYEQVGRNSKLGLTGRTGRRLKSLTSSRLYRLRGQTVACLQASFSEQTFYLAYDMDFLLQRFKSNLAYVQRHWTQLGRPTATILLTHSLLQSDRTRFYELMLEMRSGEIDGVPVRIGRLHQMLSTASFERIDYLHDFEFKAKPLADISTRLLLLNQSGEQDQLDSEIEVTIEAESDLQTLVERLSKSTNLYEQAEILGALVRMQGLEGSVTIDETSAEIHQLLEEVYEEAGRRRLWAVVRRAAGLLGKVDLDLNSAVSAILVRQKAIQVGRSYSTESLITRPIPSPELLEKINTFCRDDIRDKVLTQEMLIYLGLLIKAKPKLFEELLTVRVSYLIMLLTGQLSRENQTSPDEAYNLLMHLPPSDIRRRLESVLAQYQTLGDIAQQLEVLHTSSRNTLLTWLPDEELAEIPEPEDGWLAWRQHRGTLNRTPANFYPRIWQLFRHTQGIVIGDQFDRRNRLVSSSVLSDMTPGETAFALRIEHLLNRISAPEYRQLSTETLIVLYNFFEQNLELQVEDSLVLDAVIGHAVRIAYLNVFPEREESYTSHKADAWMRFYERPIHETTGYLAEAFQYLLRYPEAEAAG